MSDEPQDLIPELPAPAFNPGDVSLDLSTDHKIRVTALMIATKYYDGTIVKDGVMYQAQKAAGINHRSAHYAHVVEAAISFEHYIRAGKLKITSQTDLDGVEHVKVEETDPEIPGDPPGSDAP